MTPQTRSVLGLGKTDLVHCLKITFVVLEIIGAEVIVTGGATAGRCVSFELSHLVVTVNTLKTFMA